MGVQANVVDVATGSEETTNDFRFTYCTDQGRQSKRKIVPKTYKGVSIQHLCVSQLMPCGFAEAMLWLEGRRALDMGSEIRLLRAGR